ncbi:hypothetical protein ERJ75_000775200 [Trypanosoma vivax]|nr:hypothetical protein ERJ75_000775200 [Trypanosoma vivax]
MVNCPLPTLEEPPAPLPGGRLSLAQKMGLVPLPPPAPSEEEWSRIEVSVLGRIRRQPMGSNVCYICHDAFYATMEQRQVLLSCQHVFHEQCLRQFERFARQLRGKHDATPLCCPVCRNKHYHKRFFYAGKAMEQRAAVVKLQAFFRRVLARKMYVKMRLESDSEFCAEYACQRLGRLYDTWAIYADLQEKERERLFNAIDLRKQRAAAECMVPEEWDALRRRVENSSRGAPDCPICLCKIQRDLETQVEQPAQTAEEIVARLRRDYEARKAERSALINPPKATLKVATQREGKSVVKRNARRVGESRGRVGGVQAPIRATKGVSDPAVSRGEGRAESPVKCKTPDHAPWNLPTNLDTVLYLVVGIVFMMFVFPSLRGTQR